MPAARSRRSWARLADPAPAWPFVTGGFAGAGEEQPLPGVGEVVAELPG